MLPSEEMSTDHEVQDQQQCFEELRKLELDIDSVLNTLKLQAAYDQKVKANEFLRMLAQ